MFANRPSLTSCQKKYLEIDKLIIESLKLTPNSKTGTLTITDSKQHAGYIPWITIKNSQDLLYTDGRTTSVKTTLDSDTMTTELKEQELLTLHNKAQLIMTELVDDVKDIVKKYPNKYQAQLAEIAGLGKTDLDDNNWYIASVLNTMTDQKILRKFKTGNRVFFEIMDDKSYEQIPYLPRRGYASKLEAKCAKILMDLGVDFDQQVRLDKYRIDFKAYQDSREIWIEVHGGQHYKRCSKFHTEAGFEAQQLRDINLRQLMVDTEREYLEIKFDDDFLKVLKDALHFFAMGARMYIVFPGVPEFGVVPFLTEDITNTIPLAV